MRAFFLASVLLFFGCATHALAADPCSQFKWDVAKEHALFGGAAVPLTAGKDAASAPTIGTDRLYRLELSPQTQVAFGVPPGKERISEPAYAGVAQLRINAAGAYRVSVDVPLWIDVAADGKLMTTKDFQGQRGCDAPHKIVEYELPAAQLFVLQVSGSTQAAVRLTVTRSPAAKP